MSPQYLEALDRANMVRLERAKLKRDIRTGRRFVPDVLTAEIPDWLERMPTSDLLEAVPYLPKKRLHEFLYTAQLSEARAVDRTTVRQRNILAELVGGWEEKRREKSGKRARTKFERGVR